MEQLVDRPEEMSQWLRCLFPDIQPAMYDQDGCWIAFMMTRETEHNPPFAWIARAFDAVYQNGGLPELQHRMFQTHGSFSCSGDYSKDEAIQVLITETCAMAWSMKAFGMDTLPTPHKQIDRQKEYGNWIVSKIENFDFGIHVIRLKPVRTLQEIWQQVIDAVEQTKLTKPEGISSTYLYLDIWHDGPGYAYGVGYNIDVTQPIIDALAMYAGESGLRYILTRPFQWGNPITEWL